MEELVTQETITFSTVKIDGYRRSNGEWIMSVRNLAKLVNKSHSSVRSFLKSNWLKERVRTTYKPIFDRYTDDTNIIHGIRFEVFLLYLRRQEELGNIKAKFIIDCILAKSLEYKFEDVIKKPNYDVREIETMQIDNKPKSSLYVFTEINTNVSKIGISSNILERHKTLELQSGRTLEIAYVSKKMNYDLAKALEDDLHLKFDDCRMNGEWFDISAETILKEI